MQHTHKDPLRPISPLHSSLRMLDQNLESINPNWWQTYLFLSRRLPRKSLLGLLSLILQRQ